MAHDVFISHAVEDKAVADEVCRALEAEGVRCWIAPRDIPPGMDYEESIVEAISQSPVLVLILSTHSNASAHVRREVSRAFAEGSPTRVIPFRVEAVPYSKSLSYYLGSTQWIDASQPPLEEGLRQLVQHVRARPTLPASAPPPMTEPRRAPRAYAPVGGGEVSGGERPLPLAWIGGGIAALVLAVTIALFYNALSGRQGGGPTRDADIAPAMPTPQQTPTQTPTPTATPTPTRTPIRNLNLRLPANIRRPTRNS